MDDNDVPSIHGIYCSSCLRGNQRPRWTIFCCGNPSEDIFMVCSCRLMVSFCNPECYGHRDTILGRGWIGHWLLLGEGTPYCFVVVDEVVGVVVGWIDEVYQDLFFCMGEWAEIPVVAEIGLLVVELAEFGLVAGWVVELFYFVVGPFAVAVGFIARDVAVVFEIGPPPVLLIMVVQAYLALMLIWVSSGLPTRLHRMVLKVTMSNLKNYPC